MNTIRCGDYEFLDAEYAVSVYGVQPSDIQKMIAAGVLQSEKSPNGRLLVRADNANRLIKALRVIWKTKEWEQREPLTETTLTDVLQRKLFEPSPGGQNLAGRLLDVWINLAINGNISAYSRSWNGSTDRYRTLTTTTRKRTIDGT